jgi:glutamate dehydrogenase/leucine dehydrogenase
VNAKLAEVMATAFKRVTDVQQRHKCGMKTAALIQGVDRLNRAMSLRGLFP